MKKIGKILATEKAPTTVDEFYFWTDKKLITCARTCGVAPSITFSQPKDQIAHV
jgi:hypothetical protein